MPYPSGRGRSGCPFLSSLCLVIVLVLGKAISHAQGDPWLLMWRQRPPLAGHVFFCISFRTRRFWRDLRRSGDLGGASGAGIPPFSEAPIAPALWLQSG